MHIPLPLISTNIFIPTIFFVDPLIPPRKVQNLLYLHTGRTYLLEYTGNTLVVFSGACSSVSLCSFTTVIGKPIGIASASIGHSHKKRKDSLEGKLDRVLFPAECEFPKTLVPRLPQHTSKINTECTGKSKQLYSLYVISFLEH